MTTPIDEFVTVLWCSCGCDPDPDPPEDPTPEDPTPEDPTPDDGSYDINCAEPQQARSCQPPELEAGMGFFDWSFLWWEMYLTGPDVDPIGLGRRSFDVIQTVTAIAGILTRVAYPGSALGRLYMVAMMRNPALSRELEAQPKLAASLVEVVEGSKPLVLALYRAAYEPGNETPVADYVSRDLAKSYESLVGMLGDSSNAALSSLGRRLDRTFTSVAGLSVDGALDALAQIPSQPAFLPPSAGR